MLADTTLKRGTEVALNDLASLHGWYPVAIDCEANPTVTTVWWRYLGQRRLTAAFFEDSFVGLPEADRRVCRTPLSALDTLADTLADTVAPSAFIFHVSRCGSTLLTQMLATLPHCIVASEPPVLDAFFRLHHHHPQHSGGAQTLRQLVAALGQRRSACETHFVVKLDSWHMPWLPWLRSVFPQTPCVVLYRDPAQVLASHGRQRGAHMVPGLADLSRLKVDVSGLEPGDLDGYAARVLSSVFQAALVAVDGGANTGRPLTLLNYTQLPEVLWSRLLAQWAVPCSLSEMTTIQMRARFDAKRPQAVFLGDAQPMVQALAETHGLHPALADYIALEQWRLKAS